MLAAGSAWAGPPEGPCLPPEPPPPSPAGGFVLETPAQRSAWLLSYAQWADTLKTELDEWGSMSLAPFLFAPAEERATTPFALRERKDGEEEMTLNSLYKTDFNAAQGTSQFAQQTMTKNQASFGQGANPVAREIIQAQTDVYRANAQRNIAKEAAEFENAQTAVTDAQKAYDDAKAADDRAAFSVINYTSSEKIANEQVDAARDNLDLLKQSNAPTADIVAAQDKLTAALKAQAMIKASKANAAAEKERTRKEKEAAESALGKAKERLDKATTATAAPPANTTAPTGSTTAIEPTATNLGLPGLGNLSKAATGTGEDGKPALGSLGASILPDPSLFPKKDAGEDLQPAFPPMARINAAAATLTVKNILTFLGNPEAAAPFQDRRLLFAATSISVAPGWRTKRDFKGVIDAQVTVSYAPARPETVREVLRNTRYPIGLRARLAHDHPQVLTADQREFFKLRLDPENPDYFADHQAKHYTHSAGAEAGNVLIHAVSPLVDSQNLDLGSSIARQDEIALFLAASLAQAGMIQQGQFFSSWSRLRRKDVATRSTVATANSFSMGDHFGFEIGTRLRGLDDDNAKGNKAAQVLDRQTFPVLLIAGMSQQDALPHFVFLPDGRLGVEEPRLALSYSTRWSRSAPPSRTSEHEQAQRLPSEAYWEQIRTGYVRTVIENKWWFEKQYYRASSSFQQAYKSTLLNMQREASSITKALYGTGYDLPLPSRWLLQNPPGLGDSQLFDPEARVDGATLAFDPPLLRFPATGPATGRTATILLRGANLHNIDLSGIKLAANPAVSLVPLPRPTPDKPENKGRLIDRETLAIDLKLADDATTGGAIQFHLPYRGETAAGAAAAALLNARAAAPIVQTNLLTYAIGPVKRPRLNAWPEDILALTGREENGRLRTDLNLLLTGEGFESFYEEAWLTSPSWETPNPGGKPTRWGLRVPLQKGGPTAAVIETPFHPPAAEDNIILRFAVTASALPPPETQPAARDTPADTPVETQAEWAARVNAEARRARQAATTSPAQQAPPGAGAQNPPALPPYPAGAEPLPDTPPPGHAWLDSGLRHYRIDPPVYLTVKTWGPGQSTLLAPNLATAPNEWKATFTLILQGTELQQLNPAGKLHGDLTGKAALVLNGNQTATITLTAVESKTPTGSAHIEFPLRGTTMTTGATQPSLHTAPFSFRIIKP